MVIAFRHILASVVSSFVISSAVAQTLTPAMLEQFKALPKSQQETLATQYGVDLSAVDRAQTASREENLAQPAEQLPQVEIPSLSKPAAAKTELSRFGVELFDRDVSTFAPTDNAQVPSDYRVGIDDEFVLQLFGKENSLVTLQVNRDGVINLPRLGPVSVAGLTFESAQSLIVSRIEQQLIGVDAVVSMGRLRAMNIFMAGEIKVPGAYSVSALTTITQALFQSGGVTDIGSLRNVQVKRSGQTVATFDVYDLLLKGDTSNDIRLQSGDVVFVPPYEALVTVTGEVKRPRVYEVAKGETLGDIIQMSGGYKSSAFAGELVLIKKRDPGSLPQALNIRAGNAEQLTIRMSNGDIVRVLPLGDNLDSHVTLEGALARPGIYGWKSGLRVSDLIGDIRRDLLATADLSYSLIVREANPELDIEVHQFSLVKALTGKGTNADPLLNTRDKLLVFDWPNLTELNEELIGTDVDPNRYSREALLGAVIRKLEVQADSGMPTQVVEITGAVKSPGRYPLGPNYSVTDLLAAAGGADDSAFLGSLEVHRMSTSVQGQSEFELISVSQSEMSSFTLEPRDRVTVKQILDWNPTAKVDVRGEVLFPGTYFLRKGEKLSDVLERAGGFTEQAFVRGTVFTRQSIAEQEKQQANDFSQRLRREYAASMLTQETVKGEIATIEAIVQDLERFVGFGRVSIDIPGALMGDNNKDLVLQNGDGIFVPIVSNAVTIVGEVYRPGSHTHQSGFTMDDYIALAAGSTARADMEAAYLVKADGTVKLSEKSWTRFTSDRIRVEPGDAIVIPVNTQYRENIPFWRDITQILYQGIVTIAVVTGL